MADIKFQAIHILRMTVLPAVMISTLVSTIIFPDIAHAQLSRERAVEDREIDRLFWAPVAIGISTVENPEAGNLNTSVAHIFGLVSGGIDHFYGLDDGANTRLGFDYGITNKVSMGVGRMTFRKIVDVHSKVTVLRQTTTGSTPLSISVKASAGISTVSGQSLEFSDRLSYLFSVMAARKMDRFSVQLSPVLGVFNHVALDADPNRVFGLGTLVHVELNNRLALSAEYLPVLSERFRNTSDSMGIALNIDTGGHTFQIFFTSSQWHNEQFIMANNTHRFWDGDFRFGFNIHRVFGF